MAELNRNDKELKAVMWAAYDDYGRGIRQRMKRATGLNDETLRANWTNQNIKPSHFVAAALLDETEDDRLRMALETTKFELVRRHDGGRAETDDALLEALDISAAVGRLMDELRRAASPDSDGGRTITRNELEALRAKAHRAKDELAQFEALLDQLERGLF